MGEAEDGGFGRGGDGYEEVDGGGGEEGEDGRLDGGGGQGEDRLVLGVCEKK